MRVPSLDLFSQSVASTAESLPSLHLFAEAPGQHGPFADLEFLQSRGVIASQASERSCKTRKRRERPDDTHRREEFTFGLEALAAMLQACAERPGANVLLLSHVVQRGQEKSVVEDMLSAVASEHGYRAVLVDLGVARNSHGQDAEGEGLLNCLSDFALYDRLFSCKREDGLYRVARGTSTSHPLSLLLSPRFRRLHSLLASEFDLVVYRSCYATEALETFAVAKMIRPSLVLIGPRERAAAAKEMRAELAVLETPLLSILL